MSEQAEYATLYTKQERIRLVIMLFCVFLALLASAHFILLPAWTRFVGTAHCRTILDMPGLAVMAYAMFVGIPVVGSVLLELVLGWTAIRTIISKCSPPANTKVFKKTRILRGREAVLKGVFILLFVPAMSVPIVGWGYLLAGDFIAQMNVQALDYSVCVKQINNF